MDLKEEKEEISKATKENKQKEKKSRKKLIIILIVLFALVLGICFIKLAFSFELEGKKTLFLSYNEEYIEQGAKVNLFFKDLSANVKIKGDVDTSKVGKYEVKYVYKLGFINLEKKRQVEVVDTTKPTIELLGNVKQTICPNKDYIEEGYKAFDEYDGDITDKVEIIKENSSIKYKVSDSSNNSLVVERKIIREDLDKPSIKLKVGSKVYVKLGSKYKDSGYTATDNCDGDITDKVEVIGQVDINTLGTYELTYKVSDSTNNTVEVKRKVVVTENKTITSSGIPGVIYLTFDDGPSSSTTTKILNVLKEEGVKATFFVTGVGPDNLIKRMHEEGHTIAIHTYSHDYKNIYSSVDNFFADLDKIENRIIKITGTSSKITRFPGGSNNTISNRYSSNIMNTLRNEVEVRGYNYFDWNVDSNDAGTCASSRVSDKKTCVYNNVINNLSKKRANIVLMHDIKSYTANALQSIIQTAKAKGYTFEVITKDTDVVHFK